MNNQFCLRFNCAFEIILKLLEKQMDKIKTVLCPFKYSFPLNNKQKFNYIFKATFIHFASKHKFKRN